MARQRKAGDSDYNARRRERRAAERYLKKAENESGATREKYRAIAKEHFQRALDTYSPDTKQDFSAPMKRLAAEFGTDLNEKRRQFSELSDRTKESVIKRFNDEELRKQREARSKLSLDSVKKDPVQRREVESEILLSTEVGKRVLAGLVDVWGDKVSKGKSAAENRAAMTKAIFEYFNVDSWADVLNMIEESVGESLYTITENDDFYDIVKLTIQSKVADNTLIN